MSRAVDPARAAAFDVLRAVRVDEAYSNLVLPQVLKARHLSGADAARATDLASGSIRMAGFLDEVLLHVVDRDLDELDADVLDVLRLLAYDAIVRGTPTYAAVDAGVTLARSVAGEGPSRFVNAIGRRVAARSLGQWQDVVRDSHDGQIAQLAAVFSYPRWIVTALRDALGERADELPALLQAQNDPPRPVLVARPGISTVDELLAAAPSHRGTWSPLAVVLEAGSPGAVPAVAVGRAGVQDEGSQLMALALVEAADESESTVWADLAAGPGGKAALLAAIAAESGMRLQAVEMHEHRAELVRRALAAVPGDHEVICADARQLPIEPGSAGRVLLDAPCSGLGSLRRRPDSRWRKNPDDLPGLVRLQGELLNAAIDSTAVGGVVAYSTCSPVLAETTEVVDAVLATRSDVEVLHAPATLPGVTDCADGDYVRLWPHIHDTDGMFLALLRRR